MPAWVQLVVMFAVIVAVGLIVAFVQWARETGRFYRNPRGEVYGRFVGTALSLNSPLGVSTLENYLGREMALMFFNETRSDKRLLPLLADATRNGRPMPITERELTNPPRRTVRAFQNRNVLLPCANEVRRFVGVFWEYWPEGQADLLTARSFDQLCQDLDLASQQEAWPQWFNDDSRNARKRQVFFLALHKASGTRASFQTWMTGWESGVGPEGFAESPATMHRAMAVAAAWLSRLERAPADRLALDAAIEDYLHTLRR